MGKWKFGGVTLNDIRNMYVYIYIYIHICVYVLTWIWSKEMRPARVTIFRAMQGTAIATVATVTWPGESLVHVISCLLLGMFP